MTIKPIFKDYRTTVTELPHYIAFSEIEIHFVYSTSIARSD